VIWSAALFRRFRFSFIEATAGTKQKPKRRKSAAVQNCFFVRNSHPDGALWASEANSSEANSL
jgi:hypothetical protein